MTQSISIYYLPVDTGTPFQTYHEAIVYDKGDGSTPTVIQGQPSIPFNGSDAQTNEVTNEIWQNYVPFSGGAQTSGSTNSPYGTISASESAFNSSYTASGVFQKDVLTGDDLSSQWSSIQGTMNDVNAAGYAYLPLDQNSNTFASSALQNAGITPPDPTFFQGDTDQTYTIWAPAAGNSLSVMQNQNSGGLEGVTDTSEANADGSTTYTATGTDPSQSGVLTASDTVDANDRLTNVTLDYADGSSSETIYNVDASSGTGPYFAQTVFMSADGQTTRIDTDNLNGSSQEELFGPNATTSTETLNYTGEDQQGTLTSADLNFTDGTSEQQLYDPQSGISTKYQDYSSANETGTLVDQGYDFTSGGSQFEYFNPNSNVTLETDNYTGADGTGTLTSADVNFTSGGSEQDVYNPSSGVDVAFSDYSGPNETGTLEYQGDNWTAGGSQIEYFNPQSGVSTETDNYSGAYGSGTRSSADFNFTNGGSEQDIYNPSSGVDVAFWDYSGANETGTLEYQGDNWTAGGSQIEYFNPQSGVSTETDNYTGAGGSGSVTSADFNYTNGSSEQDIYNPSGSSTDEFLGYSGPNETGTLEYEGNNWTAGGSQIEFFNPENGVSTEIDNYTGAYGSGALSSADLGLTNGFSLDYSFSYDGNGNETSYVVDEYNPSDQLVWYGDYSGSGAYLGGGGSYGYGGPGGYYGTGGGYYGGGYGGGYDFAKVAGSTPGRNGSSVSEIAAHDARQSPIVLSTASSGHGSDGTPGTSGHWDPSRPFALSGGSPAGNGSHGRGSRGIDIGVIAAYDLAASATGAAQAAETARRQAFASAAADGSAGAGPQFEGAKIQTSGNVVTWSFANGPGSTVAPFSGAIGDQYKAAIEQAFQSWAAASGLMFQEVPDSQASAIRVGWGDFDTGTSGVVGYTSYRQQGGVMQSGIVIRLEDPGQDALVKGSDGQLTYAGTQAGLNQVALHEIGHALGLADNADPNSIMYYASGAANRSLDQTDIAGVHDLYGSASADGGGIATGPSSSAQGFGSASGGRLGALLGSPGSLSSLLSAEGGAGHGGTPHDARLTQMIQAMGGLHENAGGWAPEQHTPLVPSPEPPITVASHPH